MKRVMQRVESMPCSLLWFSYGKPSDKCPERLNIARTLLDTSDEELIPTARKIKKAFARHLADVVASDGAVDMQLYALIRCVAVVWRADTQELEGIMNLIQIGCTRASRISLALLDARVSSIKDAGVGSRETKHYKYSMVKDRCEDIIEDAVQHSGFAAAEMGRDGLWDIPWKWKPQLAVLDRVVRPPPVPMAALQWSHSHVLAMNRIARNNEDHSLPIHVVS